MTEPENVDGATTLALDAVKAAAAAAVTAAAKAALIQAEAHQTIALVAIARLEEKQTASCDKFDLFYTVLGADISEIKSTTKDIAVKLDTHEHKDYKTSIETLVKRDFWGTGIAAILATAVAGAIAYFRNGGGK